MGYLVCSSEGYSTPDSCLHRPLLPACPSEGASHHKVPSPQKMLPCYDELISPKARGQNKEQNYLHQKMMMEICLLISQVGNVPAIELRLDGRHFNMQCTDQSPFI